MARRKAGYPMKRWKQWTTVVLVPVVAVVSIGVAAVAADQSGLAGAGGRASAASAARSTFQMTIGGQSFTAALPTSSVGTYVLPAGSSTLTPTLTTTKKGKLSLKLAQQSTIASSTTNAALPQITVDPSSPHQVISGFGGAMTDSSAYLINNSPQKNTIVNALYGTSGANFNLTRVPLGASDMTQGSTAPIVGTHIGFQTYDDTAGDTSLSHFSMAHDQTNVIPVLQAAKAINAGAGIIATPWSAPGWMKISGNFLSDCNGSDNYLNPNDYGVYANYLAKAAKAYQDVGLPFSVISMQNEPHNCQPSYPTMMMEPSDQATFSNDLYGALHDSTNGLTNPPAILGYDHNWNDYNNLAANSQPFCGTNPAYQPTSYPQSLLGTANSVTDIGYHSYCGYSSAQNGLNNFLSSNNLPPVGVYVTESTGSYSGKYSATDANAAPNLVFEVKNDLVDPIRNGATGSLYWNLALDP